MTSSKVLWSNDTVPYNESATRNSSVSQVTPCQVGQNSNWDPDSYMAAQLSPGVDPVDYIAGFQDFCALWNSSCSGDLDTAFHNFEKNVAWSGDGKFYDCGQDALINAGALPEKSRSLVTQLLTYAQSPQCTSRYRDIHCPEFSVSSQSQFRASVFPAAPCCGACWFEGTVVDLLYWPSEDSDTSCLSVIGNTVHPIDQEAITSTYLDPANNKVTSVVVYGCTTMSRAPNGSISYEFENTASQLTIGTFRFKVDYWNPWKSHVSCVQSTGATAGSHYSHISAAPIRVRAHSLVNVTRASNKVAEALSRVAVSDGYTYTSPSVYMKIYNLTATDDCGVKPGGISTTILAFHPGELSSIVGNPVEGSTTTRRFNIADLPCPPTSIMMQNWYMPKSGEPYIPKIAWPSQLQLLNPHWKDCDGAKWFTGYDPPRILTPVAGIVPAITPDPTPDPLQTSDGAYKSHEDGRTASPAATPKPDQPAITKSPKLPSILTMLDPQADPNAVSSDPSVQATESRVQSVNPVSQNQDSGDALTRKPSLTGPRPQGSHSRIVAEGGAIHPSPVVSQEHPSKVHPGGLRAPSTAKQQTEPDNGNILGQKSESLKDPNPKQQQATTEEPLSEQPKSMVATLAPHVNPSTVYRTYNLGHSSPKVIKIQDQALTFVSGDFVYDGSTLRPGDSLKELSGTPISFGREGQLKIGTKSIHVPLAETKTKPLAGLAGDSPIRTLSNGLRVVLGATLTPGAPAISASGITMSLDIFDHLIIASQGKASSMMPNAHQPPNEVVANQATIPLSQVGVPFSESVFIVSGTPISQGNSPSIAISKTFPFPANLGRPSFPWTVIAGQTVTLLSNAIALAGTTLKPKDPAITISGTVVSFDSTALIVDSKTISVSPKPAGSISLIIAGQTVTSLSNAIALAGSTLEPKDPAMTISGTVVSLNPTALIVNSKIIPFSPMPAQSVPTIIAGQKVATLSNAIAIGGTTLQPKDPAMTISGTVVSLNPTALIINSKTIPFSPMPVERVSTIIAGQTVTAIPGKVLVDNKTISAGLAALTISGTRISVNNQGEVIVGVHTASASQIRAVITETGAGSASVLSSSQSANGTIFLNTFEGRAGKARTHIANFATAVMGFIAVFIV